MSRVFYVLLVAIMCLTSSVVLAKDSPSQSPKYEKLDSATLNKVKQKANFTLLAPKSIPKDWTIELKLPDPLDSTMPIQRVRLHYFDKDEDYMFGIEQHKVDGYKIKKETIVFDVRNNTSIRTIVEENFIFDTSGEIVKFRGIEARYTPLGDNTVGRILRWVQDGTYIEMDSFQLSKKDMIDLAISVE